MSSARIQKLKSLLARVEQRRSQPRLHAVASPLSARAPEPALRQPAAVPAPAAEEDNFDDDELFAKTDPPPALLLTEKKPAKPTVSPLEDAMALLDGSGPLDVQSLAEPIAMKPAAQAQPAVPAAQPAPVAASPAQRAPEPLFKPRMSEPDSSLQESDTNPLLPAAQVEIRPAPSSARPSGSVREPTLRFDTGVAAAPQAQVEIGGLPPAAVATPPAAPVAAPEPPLSARASEGALRPLTAASHTLEPSPLSSAVPPVRVVSPARIEVPRSFGELLELSLALRPR